MLSPEALVDAMRLHRKEIQPGSPAANTEEVMTMSHASYIYLYREDVVS
jgi:hypothetical protein